MILLLFYTFGNRRYVKGIPLSRTFFRMSTARPRVYPSMLLCRILEPQQLCGQGMRHVAQGCGVCLRL